LFRAKLQEQEGEIVHKRSDLIALQATLIKATTTKTVQDRQNPDSLKAMPIVLSRVHHFICHLSEGAMDQHSLTIPINAVIGRNRETLKKWCIHFRGTEIDTPKDVCYF
jgi:hypothetical protein